jgi:TolB-like protein/Flp pilus assembly protein TadD
LVAAQGIGSLRYLFEEYAFDTDRREIYRGTDVVSVTPQVFDLLDYLIHNRERVVSKDDLINAIWNGRAVSDAALTTRLNAARTAIGDSGEEQRLIKTLPRKGYRFVGRVQEAQRPAGAIAADTPIAPPKPALMLPDKPSIAVLPFQNMSGDPDQDYFADGMVDEITTALSRFKSLFVIARNSSFTYKDKIVDIKQVGRELGVRYVLEGSVRRAAGKVRIIGQLIDAATGRHLWADRFEGDLSDIFALQDRITESVVSAIEPKMFQTEIDLAARRPENLSAYDLCLRAVPHLCSFTRDGSAEALRLVSRALELAPRYGFAATLAGSGHLQNVSQGWAADPKSESAEGLRLLRLALSIDGNDHLALSMLGYAAGCSGDFDTAREMVDRAVALNPNAAFAWGQRGWTYRVAGQPEEAIRSFERAIRLSPFDPLLFLRLTEMGVALIDVGRFDEAVAAARKALSQNQTLRRPIAASRRPWLIWAAKQKRGRQRPVCSNSNPIFAVNGQLVAVGGKIRCLSTFSAKQGFPSDTASGLAAPSSLQVDKEDTNLGRREIATQDPPNKNGGE